MRNTFRAEILRIKVALSFLTTFEIPFRILIRIIYLIVRILFNTVSNLLK